MTEADIWWLLAGAAIVVELMTGTFYLLMLALGLGAAALAAHAGASLTLQLLVAALVGGGAVALWNVLRGKRRAVAPAAANQDVNLDVGAIVHVEHWNADGSGSVKYRGANWAVLLRDPVGAQPGEHRVVEVVGSRLVLEKV